MAYQIQYDKIDPDFKLNVIFRYFMSQKLTQDVTQKHDGTVSTPPKQVDQPHTQQQTNVNPTGDTITQHHTEMVQWNINACNQIKIQKIVPHKSDGHESDGDELYGLGDDRYIQPMGATKETPNESVEENTITLHRALSPQVEGKIRGTNANHTTNYL